MDHICCVATGLETRRTHPSLSAQPVTLQQVCVTTFSCLQCATEAKQSRPLELALPEVPRLCCAAPIVRNNHPPLPLAVPVPRTEHVLHTPVGRAFCEDSVQ